VSWTQAVLDFWFGLPPERHWRRDPVLDAEIASKFGRLWQDQQKQAADSFLQSADAALGAIILFDQFPRNMFRDDRRAFSTDRLARAIASGAVDRGHDRQVPGARRHFFYMPFQHSESLADQERSLALFEELGDDYQLGFARKHRDVIARFGRFPHRNAVLGRANSEAEEAFGLEPAW
jgi:uncharacterized protein (DUF924 family)